MGQQHRPRLGRLAQSRVVDAKESAKYHPAITAIKAAHELGLHRLSPPAPHTLAREKHSAQQGSRSVLRGANAGLAKAEHRVDATSGRGAPDSVTGHEANEAALHGAGLARTKGMGGTIPSQRRQASITERVPGLFHSNIYLQVVPPLPLSLRHPPARLLAILASKRFNRAAVLRGSCSRT